MSHLRHILATARREHLAHRYPGDLAASVMGPTQKPSQPRLLLAPLALTGIAAMLIAAVTLNLRPPPGSVPGPLIITPYPRPGLLATAEAEEELYDLTIPALPSFPETAEIAPDFSLALMPGLPSLSLASAESGSETENFTETP